jgi:hypothetical protein
MFSLTLLSIMLAFSLSSVAQEQKCETAYPFFINASDSTTRINPFQPPIGSLSNETTKWTWTLATASFNNEVGSGAVEQRLWLDTQPTLNLLSADLGVIGCGVVAHGLTHDALEKGQGDNGTCSSMLSQSCIQSILNATSEVVHGTATAESSASDICAKFQNLRPNQLSGLPSECSESFTEGAWLQSFGKCSLCPAASELASLIRTPLTVFASPQGAAYGRICPINSGAGNVSYPVAEWGRGAYSASDMTLYDNLTTSVTPLITVMLANRTVDDTARDSQWSQQYLTCLRPSNLASGSAEPTGVPSGAGRMSLTSGVAWAMTLIFWLAVQ